MRVDLAISGLGMVTPVGETAVTSAAAHRAGLSRVAKELDVAIDAPFETIADDPLGRVQVGVVAHRASPSTDGFTQIGLWLRLSVLAVRDLASAAVLPEASDTFWDRTALYAVTPCLDVAPFEWPREEVADVLESSVLGPLAELSGAPARRSREGVTSGHAGSARALETSAQWIQKGAAERVLIVACDAYADIPWLLHLAEGGRLKGPDSQTGLQPGEAAAAMLIEPSLVAKARGATVCATILAAQCATPAAPPPPPTDELTSDTARGDRAAYFVRAGILWAKVIAEALADAGISRFAGDIIVDLNGEEWRAAAWGTAQTRLQQVIDFEASNLVLPCASFGEIGAASGVAGVCLAVRSFARDYATGDATLVVSLSENGDVGAIVVGKP